MSRNLRTLNRVLRGVVQPRLVATKTPEKARRDFQRFARIVLRRPPDLSHLVEPGKPPLHHISVGQLRGRRMLLYFHGGGFLCGSPYTRAGLLGQLSPMAGIRVVALAYRLAPTHVAPAAFDDARSVHAALPQRGIAPDRSYSGGRQRGRRSGLGAIG